MRRQRVGEDKKKCLIVFPEVEKENWDCLVRHPRETVGIRGGVVIRGVDSV